MEGKDPPPGLASARVGTSPGHKATVIDQMVERICPHSGDVCVGIYAQQGCGGAPGGLGWACRAAPPAGQGLLASGMSEREGGRGGEGGTEGGSKEGWVTQQEEGHGTCMYVMIHTYV